MDFTIYEKDIIGIFQTTANLAMIFLIPFILLKAKQIILTGTSADFFELFKGILGFFLLIFSFEYIIEAIIMILDEYYIETIIDARSFSGKEVEASSTPWVLTKFIKTASITIYWLAAVLQLLVLGLLAALAPLFFLSSCVLRIGIGVSAFLTLFLISAVWPIVWGSFSSYASFVVIDNGNSYLGYISELTLQLMKLGTPILLSIMGFSGGPFESIAQSVTGGFTKRALRKADQWNYLRQPNRSLKPASLPDFDLGRSSHQKSWSQFYGRDLNSYSTRNSYQRIGRPAPKKLNNPDSKLVFYSGPWGQQENPNFYNRMPTGRLLASEKPQNPPQKASVGEIIIPPPPSILNERPDLKNSPSSIQTDTKKTNSISVDGTPKTSYQLNEQLKANKVPSNPYHVRQGKMFNSKSPRAVQPMVKPTTNKPNFHKILKDEENEV